MHIIHFLCIYFVGLYKSLIEQAKDNLTVVSPAKADVLVVHDDLHYPDNFAANSSPRVQNECVTTQQPSDNELQMEIERLTVTNYTNNLTQTSLDDATALQNMRNSRSHGSKNKLKRRRNK